MLKKIASLFGGKDDSEKKSHKGKEKISESSINLHNQALAELKVLGSIAKTLDIPAFQNNDFLQYVDVCTLFASNKGQYQGLKDSSELLRVAVQAQASFLKIEQTEMRYCSSKQQEYYKFVINFLAEKFAIEESKKDNLEEANVEANKDIKNLKKKYSPEEFKQQIRAKLAEIKPTIKTEQGIQALDDYTDALEILAKDQELGLKLLYLFKKYNLTDFSVLKTISEMVNYLQDKDLRNAQAIQDLVMKNEEIFLKVGRIIGVPQQLETPDTYGRILQFLALSKKHEKSGNQFFRLLDLLKQWRTFSNTVTSIRKEYPASKYDLPEEFTREIQGVNVYEKYGKYVNIFRPE
jgi:hypothetical protein